MPRLEWAWCDRTQRTCSQKREASGELFSVGIKTYHINFIHNTTSTSILEFFFSPQLCNLNDNRVHARKTQKGLKTVFQKSNSMFLLKIMKRDISPNSAKHILLIEMALGDSISRRNKNPTKIWHHQVMIIWPGLHTLTSPTLKMKTQAHSPWGSDPCPFAKARDSGVISYC